MLIHHSSQDYNTAASEAAAEARTKMEAVIAKGRVSAGYLLNHINTVVPKDAIVPSQRLHFQVADTVGEENPRVEVVFGDDSHGIHRHALGQIADKAGVPSAYLAKLVSGTEWERALATNILNEHFHKGSPEARYLTRSVNNDVRGFLSSRYRRLDCRPLCEAFATACQDVGAVAVDGVVSDTRVALKAFLPMVFEPVPNEVLCLGVEWGNSDYGSARNAIRAFIWRLACTNKATLEDSLAQVHLGRQLSEDIEFSNKTYALDTAASASALRDVVRGLLSPGKVNLLLETIKAANEKKVEWKNVKTTLARRLLKSEMASIEAAYNSTDVYNLPAGNTAWRASNAVSWIAGQIEDGDRKLELERVAGIMLNGKADSLDEAA